VPMCDAYIPKDALPPETEREMLSRISDLLIEHELRRATDLTNDPESAEANTKRARSVSWLLVHRPEFYIASAPAAAPYYKFVCSVPEGQADEQFRTEVTRDITAAVADAEGGKWPHPKVRVMVFTPEVPDGEWGSGGRIQHLGDIIGFVAPGMAEWAEERLADRRRETARAMAIAAAVDPVGEARNG
jgi:phenylpyruvate tautomerase PptA (4-oxalocrotonate tautomerase family)